jgi:hypothetical protein
MIRKLMASGYDVGDNLKASGLEATCIENQLGTAMLLISNLPNGPSWPQIYKSLESLEPAPALVTTGKHPAVLVQDSRQARQVIGSLAKNANHARARNVFLEDVGFVELQSKSKTNFKILLLPIVSMVLVVVLGTLWSSLEQPSSEKPVRVVTDDCIVDLSKSEFDRWLSSFLKSEPALIAGQEFFINTELGDLAIVVDKVIGSAAKVSGLVTCSDQRQLEINHRVDTSGTGDVLELGQ